MKITIESTETLTTFDGMKVRVWKGVTEHGVECRVFVRSVAFRATEAPEDFQDHGLKEIDPPLESFVDLHFVLDEFNPSKTGGLM